MTSYSCRRLLEATRLEVANSLQILRYCLKADITILLNQRDFLPNDGGNSLRILRRWTFIMTTVSVLVSYPRSNSRSALTANSILYTSYL